MLLFALLLIGHASVRAQSAPTGSPARSVTGFGDPEPMDPRYAPAAELSDLKNQLQTLLQAYDQLVTRYNTQSARLQQLERQQATSASPSAGGRPRNLRANALPGSY
ncbi:hypothetical protein GCM10027048_16520 [Hymenobacter coalescens]